MGVPTDAFKGSRGSNRCGLWSLKQRPLQCPRSLETLTAGDKDSSSGQRLPGTYHGVPCGLR